MRLTSARRQHGPGTPALPRCRLFPVDVAGQSARRSIQIESQGSGGGYSNLFARPSWQKGSGLANNGKRGYPDIAADADPHTGAYVCYGAAATCSQVGGTSLASPLWAGMIAVTNSYLAAQDKTVGFLAPTLYRLAGSHPKYAAFHHVTHGIKWRTKHWDEVTGWGSTNLYNLARDLAAMAHNTKKSNSSANSRASTGQ